MRAAKAIGAAMSAAPVSAGLVAALMARAVVGGVRDFAIAGQPRRLRNEDVERDVRADQLRP